MSGRADKQVLLVAVAMAAASGSALLRILQENDGLWEALAVSASLIVVALAVSRLISRHLEA